MKRTLAIFPLLVLLSGCTGEQLVTRRFKSMQWNTKPPHELIELKAIHIDPPQTAPRHSAPAILSLSERGQASYIDVAKQLKDLKKSDDLLNLLAKPFPKNVHEAEDGSRVDLTTINKLIVLSVKKVDAVMLAPDDPVTAADRIAKLELTLECGADWYQFQNWDKLETDYVTIDLGKVSHESSASFNANLTPKLSGSIVGDGEIGVVRSDKSSEELALKTRYITVSGMLTPEKGVVIQQGGIDRDLEGNTSVVLTIKMGGKTVNLIEFGELIDDNGTPTKPADLSLKIIPTRIPYWYENTEGVILNASADYLFRHVSEGKESVIEGDDVVTLYKGVVTAQKQIQLLSKSDCQKRSVYYFIKDSKGEVVLVKHDSDTYNLALASKEKWDAFLQWLMSLKPEQFSNCIGKGANRWCLMYKGQILRQDDVKHLGAYPMKSAGPPQNSENKAR